LRTGTVFGNGGHLDLSHTACHNALVPEPFAVLQAVKSMCRVGWLRTVIDCKNVHRTNEGRSKRLT